MNKFFIFTAFALGLIGCAPTKAITKKEISHVNQVLTFKPEQVKKNIGINTEVTITPIDAKILNKETSAAAKRDGNYGKEFATLIEKRKVEMPGMSKTEKASLNNIINKFNLVNKLVSSGEMAPEIGFAFQYRIIYGPSYGKEGTELVALSEVDESDSKFNPFEINDKYLSVFKLTFENKGKDVEKFNLKNFEVLSGEEQLYPLKNDYFENALKGDIEKVKNVYRINMPDEITLTPNQRITKYFAIPAINPSNTTLVVQHIKDNNVTVYDFQVNNLITKKTHNMESYEIVVKSWKDLSTFDYTFVVQFSDRVYFPTIANRFFVSDERKKEDVSIYLISVDYSTGKSYFSQKVNVKFDQIKNNKISIDLESNVK